VTIPNQRQLHWELCVLLLFGLTSAYFQGKRARVLWHGVFDNDAAGFTILLSRECHGFHNSHVERIPRAAEQFRQGPALLLVIDAQKAVYLTSTNLVVGA